LQDSNRTNDSTLLSRSDAVTSAILWGIGATQIPFDGTRCAPSLSHVGLARVLEA